MVALLLQPRNQCGISVGIRKETVANFSGIQYDVDLAKSHGTSTEYNLSCL